MLTSPSLWEPTDGEWRPLASLWAWVARFGEEGEVWQDLLLRGFLYGYTKSGRPRRISPRMLERFVELGLIEEYMYTDDGTEALEIAEWRDFRPIDLTSANGFQTVPAPCAIVSDNGTP